MRTVMVGALVAVLVGVVPAWAGGGEVYKAWIDCPRHPRTHRAAVTVELSATAVKGFMLTQRQTRFVCA